MRYVGAIDQGTTGTRFMLFDDSASIVGTAYEPHEQHYPRPGWVEHDPTEIWQNVKTVVRDGLADAGATPADLAAIGVTNQRETAVLWERESGEPVHNAIVWQDRRTTERIEALERAGKAGWIRDRTGLEPDAYFSATKVEWLLDNAASIDATPAGRGTLRDHAESGAVVFGTMDSWIIFNLTGEHVTDVTNASRTMLFDIHDLQWDDDLLTEFHVPRAMLPDVHPSSTPGAYGLTRTEGFLSEAVPVTGVLGDQQAALFGHACFAPGEAKNTYGTGSFLLLNTGDTAVASEHGLLTTVAFQRAGEPAMYALEGSIFVTGAAIQWLQDVDLVTEPAETERLARSVDGTDGVYLVPAFTGLGAPHWDGRARGTLVGLTRGTRREHIVRATLESIGHLTRDVVEAMEADADMEIDRLKVDGGAVKNDLLCQLQADIVGSEVVRAAVDEITALGAAYAAGLGVGYWTALEDLRAYWRIDRTFTPTMDIDEADRKHERWGAAVDRAKGWAENG